MELCRARRWRGRATAVAAIAGAIFLCLAPRALAEPFPFGSELVLDANPMRGSKKIPVLDIGPNGAVEIDLWCNSVKAQLVVAANTITIPQAKCRHASVRPIAPTPMTTSSRRSTRQRIGGWKTLHLCSPAARRCGFSGRRISWRCLE
jgi:hypothetical protein